jgi:predicted dehydrogenase
MNTTIMTASELGIPEAIPLPERRDWGIGLVGFGGIAGAHVPACTAAGFRIVAVADPAPAARERAAKAIDGVRLYEDYQQLVDDDEVEVVSLLTQPTLREPVIAAAARAGKPIQTEKPLGTDLDTCRRMVATAEKAGIRFAVSQNYRWAGANFFARHIIAKGLIGTPFYASIEILGSQDEDLKEHPFYARCEDFLTVQWNTHMVDLIRYWTDRDATRVFSRTRRSPGQHFVSDNLLMSIYEYGDGLTGHILHSELLRRGPRGATCRVDGDEGSVVFHMSGNELTLHSRQLGDQAIELDMKSKPLASSFVGPMADLLISTEQNRQPQVSARSNLATIAQVLAEHRSAKSGGVWVEL